MRNLLLLIIALLISISGQSQIEVSNSLTDEELIQSLVGPGVAISNVTVNGAPGAYGQFWGGQNGSGNVHIESGVLITTGSIFNAVGPNSYPNNQTGINFFPGYGPLEEIVQAETGDATVIEFDVTVSGDRLEFQYVFASEEYNEYVYQGYNDGFAFFISGPGITGTQNLAIIPETLEPVSVNTINNGYDEDCPSSGEGIVYNSQLFVENCTGTTHQYDGLTKILRAHAEGLTPCGTYHLILAIADTGDFEYDSGVFIGAGTFSSVGNTDFTVDINCEGNFSVTATATDPTVTQNHWELYQSSIEGVTSGGTLVGQADGGLSVTFSWLDISKFYYIRHYSDLCGLETIKIVPTFAGNATSDFHFEDEYGVEKDVFCAGEDIFLNGTASTNYDRYYLNSRRRPIGDPNAPYETHWEYGWTLANSIGVLNLSELLPSTLTFEPGFEYEIQLALGNIPECIAWVDARRTFTVVCCDVDPAFTLLSECDGGNRTVTAHATDLTIQHQLWELFETPDHGQTTGGTLVATSQDGPTALFSWLGHDKHYYIRHSVWLEGCTFEELSLPVPDFRDEATLQYILVDESGQPKETFCFGEDVYLRPINISNFDRYFMAIWRHPIGGGPTEYFNYGWTAANEIGMLNLSELFRTGGEDPGDIFEPGFVYELQFAIVNPPNCIPWIEVRRQFTVECCDGFLSGAFRLDMIQGNEGLELVVRDFDLYDNIGAIHQWFVLSSPNPDGGPYTLEAGLNTEASGPYTLFEEGVSGLYYFVVHSVSTLCGDFCVGQRRQGITGFTDGPPDDSGECELCGPIDCSVLDNFCFAPVNEFVRCRPGYSLNVDFYWDPVPGADQYLFEYTLNDPNCCGSGDVYNVVIPTNSLHMIGYFFRKYCYTWRVGTVCGEQVSWTPLHCATGCHEMPPGEAGGGDAFGKSASNLELDELTDQISVFPNPADDALSVLIPEELNVDLVTIINSEGKTVFGQKQPDRRLDIDTSRFGNGLYIIRFNHPDGTQTTQRIVITH